MWPAVRKTEMEKKSGKVKSWNYFQKPNWKRGRVWIFKLSQVEWRSSVTLDRVYLASRFRKRDSKLNSLKLKKVPLREEVQIHVDTSSFLCLFLHSTTIFQKIISICRHFFRYHIPSCLSISESSFELAFSLWKIESSFLAAEKTDRPSGALEKNRLPTKIDSDRSQPAHIVCQVSKILGGRKKFRFFFDSRKRKVLWCHQSRDDADGLRLIIILFFRHSWHPSFGFTRSREDPQDSGKRWGGETPRKRKLMTDHWWSGGKKRLKRCLRAINRRATDFSNRESGRGPRFRSEVLLTWSGSSP